MRSRRLRFISRILILLFLCSAPGYGAGLFDGLLPAATATEPAGDGINGGGLFDGLIPDSSSDAAPVSTSVPEAAEASGDWRSASIIVSCQAAFAPFAKSLTINQSGDNMVLTVSDIGYEDCLTALAQIKPADFISVSYDSRARVVSFIIPEIDGVFEEPSHADDSSADVFDYADWTPVKPSAAAGSSTASSSAAGRSNETASKYCSDCFDGECTECFGDGYMDCTAYGCRGGDCMVCFEGYETIWSGMDAREVRCRTCGGDEECNTCRGRGEVKCYKCNNGRCRTCGGDGKL